VTSPADIAAICSSSEVAIVRTLFERYAAALPFDLGYQDFAGELAGLPYPYMPPGGSLLLARDRSDATGVIGLKSFAPGIAEIKRLYVVPEARGRGIGKRLLCRAIDEARRLFYARVRLDSHAPSMGAAIALYRGLGFVEIAPYGPDLGGAIVFFEKTLT